MKINYIKNLIMKFMTSIVKEFNLTTTVWGGHYER